MVVLLCKQLYFNNLLVIVYFFIKGLQNNWSWNKKMNDMDPYETKFKEMQKYMPFLQKMIAKLKVNHNNQPLDNPRRAHLQKMEMLFELLNNRDKKLKMETLLKCENVLIKLRTKIESGAALKPSTVKPLEKGEMLSKDEILDLTGPESPPPLEKNFEETIQPVEIPTERRCSPILTNEENLNSYNHKSNSPNRSLSKKSIKRQENRYDPDLSDASPHKEYKKSHQHRREYPRRRDSLSSKFSSVPSNSVKPKDVAAGVMEQPCLSRKSYVTSKSFQRTTISTTNFQDIYTNSKVMEDSEAYSPEKLWDEYSKNQRSNLHSQCTSKYKWTNNGCKNVYSYLGGKDKDSNVVKCSSSPLLPISVPARVTPIPEVLKSPPLTANDINNLLSETAGDIFSDNISEIGTRRSVKPEAQFNYSDSTVSSLDFVRKKFAMITKISTTSPKNSSAPAEVIDNPTSPLPSLKNERLALKYNPHPRVEYDHPLSPNDAVCQFNKLNDPSKVRNISEHVNVLPTINPNDPRLKRINIASPHNITPKSKISSKSSLLPTPPNINNVFSESGKDSRHCKNTQPARLPVSYHWSKEVEKVHVSSTISEKIPRCNVVEYSSEENWNSEPETISSIMKFNKTVNSEGFKASQNVYHGVTISEGVSSFSSANNRFNALQNDKSERIKYLESKKVKDNEPKTYKEFREAKAKAKAIATEKSIIKNAISNENALKNESNTTNEYQFLKNESKIANENKNINLEKFELFKNQNFNKKDTDAYLKKGDKTLGTCNTATPTPLDKMYRTQNFSKTDIAIDKKKFKIPKKKSQDISDENFKGMSGIKEIANKTKHTTKEITNKTKQHTTEEIRTHKKPEGDHQMEKSHAPKRVESIKMEIIAEESKIVEKMRSIPANKKGNKTHSLKLSGQKEKPVALSALDAVCTNEKLAINPAKTNSKTTKTIHTDDFSSTSAISTTKKLSTENLEQNSKIVEDTICTNEEPTINPEKTDSKTTNTIHTDDFTSISAISTTKELSTENLEQNSTIVEENAASHATNTVKKLGVLPREEINPIVHKKKVIFAEQQIDNVKEMQSNMKPPRILKRRCSMIAHGSAPEVDKQKLMRANALLFEDVQEEQRQKIEIRRTRNLEGIFQKTDDNCSVSTQNIIMGKRRTRASINFNETQNVKALFKYKTTIDKDKKEPIVSKNEETKQKKNESDALCNSTNEITLEKGDCTNESVEEAAKLSKNKDHVSCEKTNLSDTDTHLHKVGTIISGSMKEKPMEIGNEIENQSNAISSTSAEELPAEATRKVCKTHNNEVDDNVPSSSGNKSYISSQTEDEGNRHAFLNKFVQEILKPNADREHILNLLSQILDKNKLEFVKTVLEFATNGDEMDCIAQIKDIKQNCTTINEKLESIHKINKSRTDEENEIVNMHISPAKQKSVKKKRNELDRLNDDIRDMFISKGVLTATGKRMCTLMAQTKEKGNNLENCCNLLPKNIPGNEIENGGKLGIQARTKAKTKKYLMSKNTERKPKPLRRSLRHGKSSNVDNGEVKSNMHSTYNDEIALSTGANLSPQDKSPEAQRQMPTLKPNTPIKFNEEELSEKAFSKVSLKNLQNKQLSKTQKLSVSKEKRKKFLSNSRKGKITKNKTSDRKFVNAQDTETNGQQSYDNEIGDNTESIKNTNVNWHNQSKYVNFCVICQKRLLANSSLHYKLHHGENYVSRFAPIILQKFKQGKLNNPLFGVRKISKPFTWFYRCPFCLRYFISTITQWLTHFQEHTAEYRYECSRCFRGGPKVTTVRRHCNYKCKGAKVITTCLRNSQTNCIKAHVCHLCNFVQLKRCNLQRHYLYQHNFDKETVDLLGCTITLINTEDVKLVEETEAAAKEAEAWNSIKAEEQVIDVDADNTTEGSFEGSTNQASGKAISSNLIPEFGDLPDTIDLAEFEKYNEQDLQDELLTLAAKAAEVVQKYTETSSDMPCTIDALISCEREQQAKEKENVHVDLVNPTVPTVSKNHEFDKPIILNESIMPLKNSECFEQPKEACSAGEKFLSAEKTINFNTITSSPCLANTTGSIFITSRNSSNSHIIDANCLARSLMEVDQSPQKNTLYENNGSNISIADRISQHFKNLEDKSSIAKEVCSEVQVETNSSTRNSGSSLSKLIVEANTEDDADWEDIEVTQTCPTVQNNVHSSKFKSKRLFQKLMFKSKKNPASLQYFSKKRTKDKVTICNSQSTIPTNSSIAYMLKESSLQAIQLVESEKEVGCSNTFKSNVNIIDDLLPDSPCNDPLELVPELAPLEPLQDLNDISSILDADLCTSQQLNNELCVDSIDHQTSIEDALDFIHEQQAQEVEKQKQLDLPNVCSNSTINRVQHVGFSILTGNENVLFKFYCLLDNCTFLYSSDAMGLENHFSLEHAETKWNGFCLICESQILNSNEQHCITKEIKHLIETHSTVTQKQQSKTDFTQEFLNNRKNENEGKEDRPRIKLRRLTGDCLSTITDASGGSEPSKLENTCEMLGAQLEVKSRPSIKLNKLPNLGISLVNPQSINKANTHSLKISEVVSLRDSTSLLDDYNNELFRTEICESKPPVSKITNNCPLKRTISNNWFENSPKLSKSLQSKRQSLSPEPIVVSETVPVGEARSGNFVITQTISAQYDGQESQEPELGINISISSANFNPTTDSYQHSFDNQKEIAAHVSLKQFRCMGKGCKYSTRVPVAMSDHLRFHEKRNLSLYQDYLHCSFCLYSFGSVDDYMEHMEQDHCTKRTNNLSQSVCNNKIYTISQSPSKVLVCMAKGCGYSSSIPINIEDHLRQHEKDEEFTVHKEYLKCNLCSHISSNVNTYMEHIGQHHYTKKESVAISVEESRAKQPDTINIENSMVASKTTVDNDEETYNKKLSEAIEDLVGRTGLPDNKLYRCVVKNCMTPLEEASFNQHVLYHTSTLGLSGKDTKFYYKCPHCNVQYQRPATLKAHIKVHARCRFFCYLCNHTTSNLGAMLKHFNENHWHTLNIFTTVLLNVTFKEGRKRDLSHHANFQIAYTEHLDESAVREFGKKLIFNWKIKKATSKTHFTSDDIDILPIQPIFPREINCGECDYRTKVRTNLYRHLQMHKQTAGRIGKGGVAQVANVDPVNPVPCLNTNEKFFDKMTNLASSSVVTSYQPGLGNASILNTNICNKKPAFKMPYMYILESKRYICGVLGCKYLTISDDLFRSHMLTVHESVMMFRCPFCNEDICKRGLSTERIFAHFKFHGAILYRCEDCNYLHYLRFLVERHVNEKHYTQKVNIIKHERSKEEETEGTCTAHVFTGCKYKEGTDQVIGGSCITSENGSNQNKTKNKWACNICGHKSITMTQIQTHCFNEHGQKLQYQCVHCLFGSQHLSAILHHIDDKHNGKAREARNIFYRISNEKDELSIIDTRPLWQRNDPTRVRHIRGILMEDEEESERNRQKLGLTDGDNNDDRYTNSKQGNTIVNFDNHISSYEFGCYYCSYKSTDFNELKSKHWRQEHNATENNAVPFYFRLVKKFGCAECLQFNGTYEELKAHLQKEHKSRYYAADIRMAQHNNKTYGYNCGYCAFVADSTSQLLKHYQRKGHQPEDIFIDNNEQLYDILKLGSHETYVQCGVCQAIFANRVMIVAHAAKCHSDVEGFSFRDLCNVPIYQCFLCSYADVCEINTVRHMCDHYGKFKVCLFCNIPQSSFNSYMQHCYGEHRQGIQKFRELYSFADIKKFLLQLNVLLPNGLILNKRSLLCNQYGSVEFIRDVYEELYKISQQPPIPRLSLGRLVAKIGQESKSTLQPKSIEKRRCTIAVEYNEKDLSFWAVPKQINQSSSLTDNTWNSDPIKKHGELSTQSISNGPGTQSISNVSATQLHKISSRRCTVTIDPTEKSLNSFMSSPIPPGAQNIVARKINKRRNTTTIEDIEISDSDSPASSYSKKRKSSNIQHSITSHKNKDLTPYSFYGQKIEEIDLTKIFTKAAIAGLDTPLTIDKFKLLFNIDAFVKIPKYDQGYSEYKHVKKACPASEKHRFT